MPRRMLDKNMNPAPVRLDYSDTYFNNDYLTNELGDEMEAMDKTIYRRNLKKDEEFKRAQEESEYIMSLKEAIEDKKKNKGAKLNLGRDHGIENTHMYGEYWGGVDRKVVKCEDPSPPHRYPPPQIRPVTTVGQKPPKAPQENVNQDRPKTSLGQISNVIVATSRFRRAAERFGEREMTPEKPKARRAKSAFYTGIDDSDDDEKTKKISKKRRPKKQFGIQYSMHKRAHTRSRRELEELVRLEALKKEKRMTHADVREQRLRELKEESEKLRYKIDKFLTGLERYKVTGVVLTRLDNKRPQTAYRF